MPCTYTGTLEGDRAYFAEQRKHDLETELIESQKELTHLTQMLCKTYKKLEGNDLKIPRGVRKWWRKHKKQDNA